MIGAIIGDIVGSKYEFHNHRSKDFEFFAKDCFFTDDTVMTLAVAKAVKECGGDMERLSALAVKYMQGIGRPYPYCGYGGRFYHWMYSDRPEPYYSYGNGAAMRVSACGFAARSIEEAKKMSEAVTRVTHNNPEGLKGAEATAVCIFLAKSGASMTEIEKHVSENYYDIDFSLDEIRPYYTFNETCQGTVPQAIRAFIESVSFEDAIRNAVSVGGDSDTLAAITGGIAQAFYGVPKEFEEKALTYLDKRLFELYKELK